MVTSVYISDYAIKAVVGRPGKNKIALRAAYEEPIPNGWVVNGIIQHPEELQGALRNFWKQHGLGRRAQLVLSAVPLTQKRLELPKVREKQLYQMLEKEFALRPEEETLGYMALPGSSGRMLSLYAVSAQYAHLERYAALFAAAGVKLDKMLISRLCLEKVLRHTAALKDKTCIVQVLDGQHLISVLFSAGEIIYLNRLGISGADGSFQFGLEVSRSVSGLQQFHIAHGGGQISEVYLCGVTDKDLEVCEGAIQQMVSGIHVFRLERDASVAAPASIELPFHAYIRAAGGLFRQPHEVDLLPLLRRKKEKKTNSVIWNYILPPLAVLALCMVCGSVLYMRNERLLSDYEQNFAYLHNPENMKKAQEADQLMMENGTLRSRSDSIAYIDGALASYPAMNSSVVETVMDCAGDRASVSVQSYLAETGLLTLNTEAGEAALINEFVDALYDSGLFREIDYTGYTYSEARDTYTINVLCYLQEHAGKEEVAQP